MRKVILGQGQEYPKETPEGEMEAGRASLRPGYPKVPWCLTQTQRARTSSQGPTQLQGLKATQLTQVQDQRRFCLLSYSRRSWYKFSSSTKFSWVSPSCVHKGRAKHISWQLTGRPPLDQVFCGTVMLWAAWPLVAHPPLQHPSHPWHRQTYLQAWATCLP